MARAALAHDVDELPQAGNEAVVPDAQERAARDVTNAGGFHHQHARLTFGEPRVPVEHVLGDEAVLRRAPRDHGRDPRSLLGDDSRADRER